MNGKNIKKCTRINCLEIDNEDAAFEVGIEIRVGVHNGKPGRG